MSYDMNVGIGAEIKCERWLLVVRPREAKDRIKDSTQKDLVPEFVLDQ